MINFKNKNILITGASGGIGNELVKKFILLGGNVLGVGTKTEKLDLLKKKYLNFIQPESNQTKEPTESMTSYSRRTITESRLK